MTLILAAAVTLSGCAALLIGGGVAVGVAVSQDTARAEVDASFDKAWKATTKTFEERGIITAQTRTVEKGTVEASIDGAHVVANIKKLTSKALRIEIKARKNLLPQIDLAASLCNKIYGQLVQGR